VSETTGKATEKNNKISELLQMDTAKLRPLLTKVKDLKKRAENFANAINKKVEEFDRIEKDGDLQIAENESVKNIHIEEKTELSLAAKNNKTDVTLDEIERTQAKKEDAIVEVRKEELANDNNAGDVTANEDKSTDTTSKQQNSDKKKEQKTGKVGEKSKNDQQSKIESAESSEIVAKTTTQDSSETKSETGTPNVEQKPSFRPELRANYDGEIKKFVATKTYIPQDNGSDRRNNRNGNNFNGNNNGRFDKNGQNQNRPFHNDRNNQNGQSNSSASTAASAAYIPQQNNYKGKDNSKDKKKFEQKGGFEDKKINKKSAMRRDFIAGEELDEEELARRYRTKKNIKGGANSQSNSVIESAVVNVDPVPIKTLAEKIGKPGAEIVKKLMLLGMLKSINDSIDFETASLISSDLGVTLELKLDKTLEDKLEELVLEQEIDDESKKVKRAPIVTIMGHVDHGKTSLLDYIRKSNVASGEAGGITQHIGAYTIRLKGEKITFIDTPGHEAFTSMRARGAMVTDIAVIVVAADDSIMPQTKEAISHAKAAGVPIIVAINKIDKAGADIEKVKVDLSANDLLIEEWGGDVMCFPVSAKTGENVDKLLEGMLLLAEMNDLKANPKAPAKGTIIEAKLDKNTGPVATVLVQNGTLKIADTVVAGSVIGKIKSMTDDKGMSVKTAGPSTPVSVLGFDEVPNAGEQILVVDEKLAKQIAAERKVKKRIEEMNKQAPMSLQDLFAQNSGEVKELNLIIKGDVQGSVEALIQELKKLSGDEVKVKIIHSGVGAVTESDVNLAVTSNAIIVGFNVRPDTNAKTLAAKYKVDIRNYRIIYDLLEDIEAALKGMLAPKFEEVTLGKAEVREIFHISNVGTIAGSYIIEGKVERNALVRLLRDNIVIFEGKLSSLKRMKDDAKEVLQGFECGIGLSGYNDIKKGDIIECYVMEQING